MTTNEPGEGWGFPYTARKCHYFTAEQTISLCGKWMFTGRREPDTGSPSPDDCAECARRLAKLKADQ